MIPPITTCTAIARKLSENRMPSTVSAAHQQGCMRHSTLHASAKVKMDIPYGIRLKNTFCDTAPIQSNTSNKRQDMARNTAAIHLQYFAFTIDPPTELYGQMTPLQIFCMGTVSADRITLCSYRPIYLYFHYTTGTLQCQDAIQNIARLILAEPLADGCGLLFSASFGAKTARNAAFATVAGLETMRVTL